MPHPDSPLTARVRLLVRHDRLGDARFHRLLENVAAAVTVGRKKHGRPVVRPGGGKSSLSSNVKRRALVTVPSWSTSAM